MRSYTNKKGDLITVSKEHLEMAVKIKKELQKMSPSRRCNWSLHKKLMEEEGYFESSTCEPYRCLIKGYQKAIGELPSAPKHADMVSTSKLESIREMVGDLAWEKRENQQVLRDLNKVKRDVIDNGLFIDEVRLAIRNVLNDFDWETFRKQFSYSPIKNHGETRLIAVVTDWHIGALVDVEGNKYNYDIAVRRIMDYTDQIIALANEKRVYQIDVVYCGDILEHAYMRNSQAYHAEFPVSKQMTLAGRLMIKMLLKLSETFYCTYRGFSGNHDRLNGNKNDNIDGDTGMVVVNEMVEMFIETSGLGNLEYVACEPYHAKLLNINGKNLKFVHGDLEKKADTGKINDHSSRDGIIYDAIVYGHFHHWMSLEVGINKWEIRIGSTKGSDDYSEKLGLGSAPSQGAILVTGSGEIQPVRIGLR